MFEAHAYSIDTLKAIPAQKSGAPEDIVSSKLHRHYFQSYFQEIGAQTMVVEVAEKRHQALTINLLRFLWRATASCQSDLIVDLVFDATDTEQSPFLVYAVGYDCSFLICPSPL
ncbi:MAG: hypothetical protein P4L43_20510 [Syntrophobacteraceae bacterium]|nr:hypothetical protein [Syntrophobacteraceae bacterium]